IENRNTNGSTVPPVTACIAPPLAAAMMSSWASVILGAASCAAGATATAAPTVASLAAGIISMNGLPRRRRCAAPSCRALRRAFGGKARMNYGAVARERGRLHDLIVPLDRQRLRALVHKDLEEGEKILGVEARCRGGDAAGNVEVADDLHAARVHDLAGLGNLAIAAALDREIDDHRSRPHGSDHVLGNQPRRRPARNERRGDDDVLL